MKLIVSAIKESNSLLQSNIGSLRLIPIYLAVRHWTGWKTWKVLVGDLLADHSCRNYDSVFLSQIDGSCWAVVYLSQGVLLLACRHIQNTTINHHLITTTSLPKLAYYGKGLQKTLTYSSQAWGLPMVYCAKSLHPTPQIHDFCSVDHCNTSMPIYALHTQAYIRQRACFTGVGGY